MVKEVAAGSTVAVALPWVVPFAFGAVGGALMYAYMRKRELSNLREIFDGLAHMVWPDRQTTEAEWVDDPA
jgi:hypothetical protein